jgi:hypothetical protein
MKKQAFQNNNFQILTGLLEILHMAEIGGKSHPLRLVW